MFAEILTAFSLLKAASPAPAAPPAEGGGAEATKKSADALYNKLMASESFTPEQKEEIKKIAATADEKVAAADGKEKDKGKEEEKKAPPIDPDAELRRFVQDGQDNLRLNHPGLVSGV